MICQHCYQKLPDGSEDRFCTRCGHPLKDRLKRRCPRCQKKNPAENVFCVDCGVKLMLQMDEGHLETATACFCPIEPIDPKLTDEE